MEPFSQSFQDELNRLFRLRRDVRRFLTRPVDQGLVDTIIAEAGLAPSVGLSEPWRFVAVDDDPMRKWVRRNFEAANVDALAGYDGDDAKLYASLKLAGLETAPVQLAVFSETATDKGRGLGRQTMPEMTDYSVVCAIMVMWLSARARGLGLGWVSILDPERLASDLGTDPDWRLIAYLCIGWPEEEMDTPELERAGWEVRSACRTAG